MFDSIAIGGATVAVAEFGGQVPVQGTGTITVPSARPVDIFDIFGVCEVVTDWYFRARGQHWSVTFGKAERDGYVSGAGALLDVYGPSGDVRPYSAGYMEEDECQRHLTFALSLFAAGIRGEVEIPDPPDLLPPCMDCGAPTSIRVERIPVCEAHRARWETAFATAPPAAP